MPRTWRAADIGWVIGHGCIVHRSMGNGAIAVMHGGAPDWPNRGGFPRTLADTTSPAHGEVVGSSEAKYEDQEWAHGLQEDP